MACCRKKVKYKYLVMLGDGMADRPVGELGDKTPLECAVKPNMDRYAALGELGMAKTVPDHLNPPGSDIANMSVMGYNPEVYYTGRSPLEAVSMGISLDPDDIAIRMNLVTLSNEANIEDTTMLDYSAGEISTAEASELVKALANELGDLTIGTDISSGSPIEFHAGISYRHCFVIRNKKEADMQFTPPHDITNKKVRDYLPKGTDGAQLLEIMKKSREILANHPINQARVKAGKNPANSAWFWGWGRKPGLSNFTEKTGLKGCVISAVDLIKGLGLCAGMEVPNVEGATGVINTNYAGKAQAAIDFYEKGGDFVYLHVEAPDECGHHGQIHEKVRAIELLDSELLTPIESALRTMGPYRIIVLPDHPTPLDIRTHTHDMVPWAIYDSERASVKFADAGDEDGNLPRYTEADAEDAVDTGVGSCIAEGYRLMDYFLGNNK